MKKQFLDLNDIKASSDTLKPGTICEFKNPIEEKGCPTTKNLGEKRNYVKLKAQVGMVVIIGGRKFLKVKKIRDNGFSQKNPKFAVAI